MPELRKDPVVDRWVIIATERARRPGNFIDTSFLKNEPEADHCILCQKQDKIISSYKIDPHSAKPWDVCTIPFQNSFLNSNHEIIRRGHGPYDIVSGFGQHEMVVETPDHIANMADLDQKQIALTFKTYAHRIAELSKNEIFQYIFAYKNYGTTAGSRQIRHTRSHIIAAPVTPTRIMEKLNGSKLYFDEHHQCVYCAIIKQELADKKRLVMETEHFVAVVPFAPRFLFETWIIPKIHDADFTKGLWGCEEDLAYMVKQLLLRIREGLGDPAYNYVIHSAPLHRGLSIIDRWRTINQDFHWHMELMPRLTLMAGFEKGTGFYICTVPPEMMADYLRKVEIK